LGLLCGVPEMQPLEATFNWSTPHNNSTNEESYFSEYRPLFCVDEPLCLDIVTNAPSQDIILPQPNLTQDGYVVHNTFIDSIRPPLTPSTTSAHKRSKSLPRDLVVKMDQMDGDCTETRFVGAVPGSPALTASPWTPQSRKPENVPLLEMSRQVLRLSDFV